MAMPMCPWCGDEALEQHQVDVLVFVDDVCETLCGGCDEPIGVWRNVTVTYYVSKPQQENAMEEE